MVRDPIGIEALLHHRPRIALDDNRQAHHQRLANAARPGLADEVIGDAHEARNLAREAFDMMRERQLQRGELLAQTLIVPAHKDELRLQTGGGNAARDGDHFARAAPAPSRDRYRSDDRTPGARSSPRSGRCARADVRARAPAPPRVRSRTRSTAAGAPSRNAEDSPRGR